jgi:hypothetical protein
VKDALRNQYARLNRIHHDAKDYLTLEALVRRGQLRVEWVLEELALIEKGSVKKKKKEHTMADAKGDGKGADTQGSAATATCNSIKGGLENCRQLRKRKRNDGDEEQGTGTDTNPQNEEAAPSLLKRSCI